VTTPAELARWFDDAHHALDTGQPLTIDHIMALAATPDGPAKVGQERTTWWSEELARVAQQKCRDAFPAHGSNDDVTAWLRRQEHYEMQLESLADAHAEAVGRARGHAPAQKPTTRPVKRSAGELSLDALEDAA
jgi:hypothetical protein